VHIFVGHVERRWNTTAQTKLSKNYNAVPTKPFWQTKSLDEMSDEEWESICDGCGRCCLVKLEDIDSGNLHYTSVACRLLDTETCQCSDYRRRIIKVPDCLELKLIEHEAYATLPDTCAYRLLYEGEVLAWWHPLISGDKNTVHQAGISVRGKTICESHIHPDELEDHVVDLTYL